MRDNRGSASIGRHISSRERAANHDTRPTQGWSAWNGRCRHQCERARSSPGHACERGSVLRERETACPSSAIETEDVGVDSAEGADRIPTGVRYSAWIHKRICHNKRRRAEDRRRSGRNGHVQCRGYTAASSTGKTAGATTSPRPILLPLLARSDTSREGEPGSLPWWRPDPGTAWQDQHGTTTAL
jgi:hypothetical protein